MSCIYYFLDLFLRNKDLIENNKFYSDLLNVNKAPLCCFYFDGFMCKSFNNLIKSDAHRKFNCKVFNYTRIYNKYLIKNILICYML